MILSSAEIRNNQIIEQAVEDNFRPLNYDVSIGTILDEKGGVVSGDFILEPRGVVYVISKEVINLKDKSIIGYATIKTGNSSQGLLATNIGLIDPNYHGYLSSILLNFGKEQRLIRTGDIFLRLTFHEHKELITIHGDFEDNSNLAKYSSEKKKFILNGLGKEFLDNERLIREVSEKVVSKELLGKWLPLASLLFAVVLVIVPLMPMMWEKCFDSYVSPSERKEEDRFNELEKRMNSLEVQTQNQGVIKATSTQLDSLITIVKGFRNQTQHLPPSLPKEGS